jgi:hypothetical protein
VILKGETLDNAFETVKKMRGIWAVKKKWKNYDPQSRTLDAVIGDANWKIISRAAGYRNDLVHGSEHKSQKVYARHRKDLLKAVDDIRERLGAEYRYSGWKGMRDHNGNRL